MSGWERRQRFSNLRRDNFLVFELGWGEEYEGPYRFLFACEGDGGRTRQPNRLLRCSSGCNLLGVDPSRSDPAPVTIYTVLVPRLPAIRPMGLTSLPAPFSDPDWDFLK
jgi:hypothetical protein